MGRRFDDRLIPPGIHDARVRYLWGAFDAALAGLELSPGTLCMRTSAEMTAEMLPLAVWELSLEEFMPEEGLPEHVARRLIDRAYELHALKGTDEGVKLGLKLLTGLTPDIVHWWQKSPRGHHDTHTITVWVGEAVYGDGIILSEKVQRAALKVINATKRWSQDTDFRLGAGWSSRLAVASAAAAVAVDRRTIAAGRNTDHRDVLAAADAASAMMVAHRTVEAGRDTDLRSNLGLINLLLRMQVVSWPPVVADGRLLNERGDVSGPGVRALLNERIGFARRVTGGAGGRLWVVRSAADDGEGSLRQVLERLRRSGRPGWVIFDESLKGRTIRLRKELRLPDNVTLDGRGSGVGITAPATSNILAIRGARNVIITGLSLFRRRYRELGRRNLDAISIIGGAGPVWIHRNRFFHCGDGCVDVAMMKPPPRPVHVTISNNTFSRHNKVMLVGVLTCSRYPYLPACRARSYAETKGLARPSIFLTVAHNTFLLTSQRHPKVYSRAYAHVFGNTYVLGATAYEDERHSAVYGVGVDKGGAALVENNVFRLAPGTRRGAAVLNGGSGHADLEGNRFIGNITPYQEMEVTA